MATMKAGFTSQGKEGIVKARAVEDRLMRDTWEVDGYDLLPKLRNLSTPTLVIAGDHDFIPARSPRISRGRFQMLALSRSETADTSPISNVLATFAAR